MSLNLTPWGGEGNPAHPAWSRYGSLEEDAAARAALQFFWPVQPFNYSGAEKEAGNSRSRFLITWTLADNLYAKHASGIIAVCMGVCSCPQAQTGRRHKPVSPRHLWVAFSEGHFVALLRESQSCLNSVRLLRSSPTKLTPPRLILNLPSASHLKYVQGCGFKQQPRETVPVFKNSFN